MKSIYIIRVMIILFIIFSGANLIFSWLSDQAGFEVIDAYNQRHEFNTNISRLHVNSLHLTGLARTFIITSDSSLREEYYLQTGGGFTQYVFCFSDILTDDASPYETALLLNAEAAHNNMRALEILAFQAYDYNDIYLAHMLVFCVAYRRHVAEFAYYLDNLVRLTGDRLEFGVLQAEQRDMIFETLAYLAVLIFALVGIFGLFYLMYALEGHIERDRQAKEMSNLFLRSAPHVMAIFDSSKRPISVNEQAKDLFNLSRKEEYIERFDELHPQFQPCGSHSDSKIIEHLNHALEHGSSKTEWTHVSLNGEMIPTEVSLTRFQQDGEFKLLVYIFDLRQAKAVMQQQQAIEDMRDANQAKTRFLARMSHEIRTPLSSIMGITEIQLQTGKLSRESEEAFLRINTASDVLLTIINDILDLAKVEAGKMEVVNEAYETTSVIVDTVQLNLMYIGSKGIEFKLEIDENLPTHFIGDALRIKQVLNNLLSNAFKYTHRGTVSLSINIEDSKHDDEIILIFKVKDTGVGMTPEQLENLFSEFNRGDNERNRQIQGTGLGMSIASHLINLMGGSAEVESTVDVGTCVTVKIPQKPDSSHVLGIEAVKRLARLKDSHKPLFKKGYKIDHEPMPYGRVLVVDDVESNLYVARGLLSPYKLNIETAVNGKEAVSKVESGKVYDIIFMDHMMPVMDGMEATKIIKKMGYTHPIIALTANTIKGQADIFLGSGFESFISKPIDINDLDSCLMRFVRDKQPKEIVEAARAVKKEETKPAGTMTDELEQIFLKDVENILGVLGPIAKNNSYEEELNSYITHVHAIKSALSNIGMTSLSKNAAALEKAGKNGQIDILAADTEPFIKSLKNSCNERFSKRESPETFPDSQKMFRLSADQLKKTETSDDLDFLQNHLRILQKACIDNDVKTINEAEEALNEQPFSQKTRAIINEILSHIQNGSYSTAAEQISAYSREIAQFI